MIAIDTKMPNNCAECVLRDIRNVFGTCPCDLLIDYRPPNCPLLEVGKIRSERLAVDTESREVTEKFLFKRLVEFIYSHRELIQFKQNVAPLPDDISLCKRAIAELNIVLPKGVKLDE